MDCCTRPDEVIDWYEWENASPIEITDLVAYANIVGGAGGGGIGTRSRVSDFASQSWSNPIISLIQQPVCQANGADKGANVADAENWMFDHKTWDNSVTLPIPLRKVMFMRAGTEWRMLLHLLVSGPVAADVIYLALRDNAGTRGDPHGTYPVLMWTSTGSGFSGPIQLYVDLKRIGRYNVVLWVKSKPKGTPPTPEYSMYEMEWIVVE